MAGSISPSRNRTLPQKAALFGGMKQTQICFGFAISAVPEYGESIPVPARFFVILSSLLHFSQDLVLHCFSYLKLKIHVYWTFTKTSTWKCPQSVRRGWLPFKPLPCAWYLLNLCKKTCWFPMWQEFLVYISIFFLGTVFLVISIPTYKSKMRAF